MKWHAASMSFIPKAVTVCPFKKMQKTLSEWRGKKDLRNIGDYLNLRRDIFCEQQ